MSIAYKLSQNAKSSPHDCVALDVILLNRNTFGDAALRTEILGLFLAQLDGAKRSLGLPVDKTSWQFLCHTLKGAAASVGATQLAALADDWAKLQVPKTAQHRQALLERLSALTIDFKTAVEQL